MERNRSEVSVDSFVRVEIPTTSEFLTKWHVWIHGKVSKHFKRDKERIPDTAQRVRLRLLSKDFISRWFFKHLTDDVVDLSQFIKMTGNKYSNRSPKIAPIRGNRYDSDSLWRISDILRISNFDYERYFYSVQNHTIDTDKFLRLLGVGSTGSDGKWVVDIKDYSILESLYRQGRIKPSELTEHDCKDTRNSSRGEFCSILGCSEKHFCRGFCRTHYRQNRNNSCPECVHGRELLNQKGVSLYKRWSNPDTAKIVAKLRWNDSQLVPFLREWRKSNLIKEMPRYIMRLPKEATIDAGLLKYANMVIDNDVFNHFKSMIRSEDISYVALDVKADPDSQVSGISVINVEDEDDTRTNIFVDGNAYNSYVSSENQVDLMSLISKAGLSVDERNIISLVDLEENSVSEVSNRTGYPVSKVNRIRNNAINKLRVLA